MRKREWKGRRLIVLHTLTIDASSFYHTTHRYCIQHPSSHHHASTYHTYKISAHPESLSMSWEASSSLLLAAAKDEQTNIHSSSSSITTLALTLHHQNHHPSSPSLFLSPSCLFSLPVYSILSGYLWSITTQQRFRDSGDRGWWWWWRERLSCLFASSPIPSLMHLDGYIYLCIYHLSFYPSIHHDAKRMDGRVRERRSKTRATNRRWCGGWWK